MSAEHDDKTVLKSGFAVELGRQLEAAADAAASDAPPVHAGRMSRRWLIVAAAGVVSAVAVAIIVAVPFWRSGGGKSDVVALTSPSPAPSSGSRREMAPAFEDVTTITQLHLDGSAQPWISGSLGEQQPSFVAYLSGNGWQRLPLPTGSESLRVLCALSPRDVWATARGGLVHWDGSSWQKTPVSWCDDIGSLDAMAPATASDIWAVGRKAGRLYKTTGDGPGEHTQGMQPATMHWNGSAWTEVAVPTPPGRTSWLNAVSSREGETWAVGSYERKLGEVAQEGGGLPLERLQSGPIVLRWEGRRWGSMDAPDPTVGGASLVETAGGTGLVDVLVLGRDDVWILGQTIQSDDPTGDSGDPLTYLAHWNGARWQRLAVPHGSAWGRFATLSGTGDDDLWLGGEGRGGVGFAEVAHWDGVRWTLYGPEVFASRETADGEISGEIGGSGAQVVAASPTDVWFNAGFTDFWFPPSEGDQRVVRASACDPALFHWDGRSWRKVRIGF